MAEAKQLPSPNHWASLTELIFHDDSITCTSSVSGRTWKAVENSKSRQTSTRRNLSQCKKGVSCCIDLHSAATLLYLHWLAHGRSRMRSDSHFRDRATHKSGQDNAILYCMLWHTRGISRREASIREIHP